MLRFLFPDSVSRFEKTGIILYTVITIVCVVIGMSSDFEILMVIPLLPILFYALSSSIQTGIALLLISFPLSFTHAVQFPKIGLQIPTEPLVITVAIFWFARSLLSGGFFPSQSSKGKYLTATYIIYFLILAFSVLISTHKFLSLKAVGGAFLYSFTLIYIMGSALKTPKDLLKLLTVFSVITILAVLYSTLRHAGYGFSSIGSNFAPRPFFREHGTYGAYMAIVLGLFLPQLISKVKDFPNKLILHITVVASLIGVTLSFARAAWVSVVVLIAFLIIVKFREFLNFKTLALISLLTLILSVAILRLDIVSEIEEQAITIVEFDRDESTLERFNRWVAAYNMWLASPVYGHGFGTYMENYQDYRDFAFTTAMSEWYKHAHNDYLQHLAEVGVIGLIGWLLFLITLFWTGLVKYKNMPENWKKNILLGALGGVLTYLIHAFFNGFLLLDKVAVPFWFSVGVIFFFINSEDETDKLE